MDFIVNKLKKNSDFAYGDIRAAAEKKGLTIYPIMYGRAKAMLGLVEVAPRGKGKAKARKAAKTAGTGAPNLGTWNDDAYTAICAKHPILDDKPESVALAVWALEQHPDLDPDGFRALSEKTGIPVRGRAIGSARDILGRGGKSKSTPVRRGSAKSGRATMSAGSGDGTVSQLLDAVRALQAERDDLAAKLERVRELVAAG